MSGSIEKRGDNSWRLIVSCGINSEGKQIKKTKTIKTTAKIEKASRKEAEVELAKFVAEIEAGQYIGTKKLTFTQFVDRWLRDYAEKNLAPKTVFRYKQILDSRILPAMGHLKIEQIRPVHLMEFYNNLQEDGIRLDGREGCLSEKTILQHHRVLSSIFNDAVQWQVITSNPAGRVKPPKVRKKQAAWYNEEQTLALLYSLVEEPLKYRTLITLALASGLRRGELMGLEWQDIDFSQNTLVVRQASQYLPQIGSFTKEPKNETSKRLVTLPESVTALLRQYKAHQAEERLKVGDLWQGSDRLFTTWDGQPMHVDTITKWFPKFLRRHDLPALPFHGLRHYSCDTSYRSGLTR
jgi:integrase